MKGWGLGAGVFAVGKREGDQLNTYDVPAYARIDASTWYDVNEHVRLQLNVKNLTDRRYVDVAIESNTQPGAPLTVTGSVRVTF